MPEYTGFALRGTSGEETRLAVARWRLDGAGEEGTLVRSFAYATGPAWGLLLDGVAPGWRASYRRTSDLAATAVAAAKLTVPVDVFADEVLARLEAWRGGRGPTDDLTLVVVDIVQA